MNKTQLRLENSILSAYPKKIRVTIHLPGSKSESNRALIIQASSDAEIKIENLSEAADTCTLKNLLNSKNKLLDVGLAGTAMRFLTAFATLQMKETVLTGSEAMQGRPIGILIDALRQLGASIHYQKKEGYPPLQIQGAFQQLSNKITMQSHVSSQYISALLLIAPRLPLGLELQLIGEPSSKPYIDMTLTILAQAGIAYTWEKQKITIPHQSFQECTLVIEPDWTAASYWYAMATLAEEAEIFLLGLKAHSLQGDSQIRVIMTDFGIRSEFNNTGLVLKKGPMLLERRRFDCKDFPDLAQTLIVCCAALGHDATFTGLETLKIKETNRIKALQTELAKIGVLLIENKEHYQLDCSGLHFPDKLYIRTYQDHRMAMAFAALAFKVQEIEIEDRPVVKKSYPHFWDDLLRLNS